MANIDESNMVRVNWENQGPALLRLMDTLFQTQTLVDCTLSGKESSYKVHKVLLSSCSPYFEKIITETPSESHPILIMDANDEDLSALVQYMYKGYTDIPKENVNRFLKIAMPFHCRGVETTENNFTNVNESFTEDKMFNKELSLDSFPDLAYIDNVKDDTWGPSRKKRRRKTDPKRRQRSNSKRKSVEEQDLVMDSIASENDQIVTEINKEKLPTSIETKIESSIINLEQPVNKSEIPTESKVKHEAIESKNPSASVDEDLVLVENKDEVYVIDDDDDESQPIDAKSNEIKNPDRFINEMIVEIVETPNVLKEYLNDINYKRMSPFQVRRAINDNLDSVIQILPDDHYKCIFCLFARATDNIVKNHIVKNHVEELSRTDLPSKTFLIKAFECRWCNEKFHTYKAYNEHVAKEHANAPYDPFYLKCVDCGKLIEDLVSYRRHCKESHNKKTRIISLFCGLCGEKTNNSPYHTRTVCDLMRSGKMPHQVMIRGDIDIKAAIMCDKCLKIFNSWEPFKEHYTIGCTRL